MDKTENPITFSVIIPSYNTAHLIGECLDSIFGQDFDSARYEVIVVNDMSPDNADEAVEKYRGRSNLVYVKHSENKCQGGARNTGLDVAKGEYVMFVDSDDCWMYSNVFSTFAEIIDRYHPNVVEATDNQGIDHDYKAGGLDCYRGG